jgi:hypothetical protein
VTKMKQQLSDTSCQSISLDLTENRRPSSKHSGLEFYFSYGNRSERNIILPAIKVIRIVHFRLHLFGNKSSYKCGIFLSS